MHRTSHFLGMDVHDVGRYFDADGPRKLAEGMVVTVEPGLYFSSDDDTVDAEYRGIGVRIEDDVLVLESGPSVLSLGAPKTIEEIEAAFEGK
jgi:Xaa-Pro aminopeptidase